MADPVYTNPCDHPGILDLTPEEASLETKSVINSVQGDEFRDGGKSYCLITQVVFNQSTAHLVL